MVIIREPMAEFMLSATVVIFFLEEKYFDVCVAGIVYHLAYLSGRHLFAFLSDCNLVQAVIAGVVTQRWVPYCK